MHYRALVLLNKEQQSDIRGWVDKLMAPYNENLEKPLTKVYFTDNWELKEIAKLAEKLSGPALFTRIDEYFGYKQSGHDEGGYYYYTTWNQEGHWDYWVIGGRHDGYITGNTEEVLDPDATYQARIAARQKAQAEGKEVSDEWINEFVTQWMPNPDYDPQMADDEIRNNTCPVRDLREDFKFWTIVTPNGNWYYKNTYMKKVYDLGWEASWSKETEVERNRLSDQAQREWDTECNKILADHSDCLGVCLDYHS